jgi:hypothetical protein
MIDALSILFMGKADANAIEAIKPLNYRKEPRFDPVNEISFCRNFPS